MLLFGVVRIGGFGDMEVVAFAWPGGGRESLRLVCPATPVPAWWHSFAFLLADLGQRASAGLLLLYVWSGATAVGLCGWSVCIFEQSERRGGDTGVVLSLCCFCCVYRRLHQAVLQACFQPVARVELGCVSHGTSVFQRDAVPFCQQFLRRSIGDVLLQ